MRIVIESRPSNWVAVIVLNLPEYTCDPEDIGIVIATIYTKRKYWVRLNREQFTKRFSRQQVEDKMRNLLGRTNVPVYEDF